MYLRAVPEPLPSVEMTGKVSRRQSDTQPMLPMLGALGCERSIPLLTVREQRCAAYHARYR